MNKENEEQDQSDESLSLEVKKKGFEESGTGTVFVDGNFRVKPFVSTIAELMEMNSFKSDYEFEELIRRFGFDGIKNDINYVIKNQERAKREVTLNDDNTCYLMEMRPYQSANSVKGVLINFMDTTEIKEAKEELVEKVEKIKNLQRQIINNDVSERWKVGQYLHDDIGQSLVSADILLKSLRNKLEDEESDLKEDVDKLVDIIGQSMEGIRDLSHQIVPVDIEEKGISHAFNNFAKQLEKNHDFSCELEYDETVGELEDIEIATHLYRIVYESAKNAAVHGSADNVKITLQSDDEYLYLNIADDGTGFSDGAVEEAGMGINIMGHRMELIGGMLEVKETSEIGKSGATISCKVPIEKIKG